MTHPDPQHTGTRASTDGDPRASTATDTRATTHGRSGTPEPFAATPATRVGHLPGGGLAALLSAGLPADLVNLAMGTPEFPATPAPLVDAAHAALRAGAHQYTDPSGLPALRARIAAGLPGSPDPADEITVTVGGSEGLCVALLTVVDPGDEVIVLEPFYENFLSAIAMAQGVPVRVPLRGRHWLPDPDELAAAFGPRTRALILNSPANPTGTVLDRDLLHLVAELCEKWNVTVVSDEVYAPFVYDDGSTGTQAGTHTGTGVSALARHCSVAEIPGLADRSMVIGSLSKSHAVSGWRIGFLRARPHWTRLLRQVHVATTAGAPTPLQHAAASMELFGDDVRGTAVAMRERRDLAVALLRESGFTCEPPRGGCYVMAGIRELTTLDSPDFVRELMNRTGVLMAPATAFYADPRDGAGHVRVAFNRTTDTLEAARKRLSVLAASTPPGSDSAQDLSTWGGHAAAAH
ncbi:pyridoxal phosphate-dependent aminotransferase [Streptomyces sp. NPDC051561]|uniref:pyridoxal phosphate-dependent aminotransferase n=1 Tax=Streptomyces sp. NPDC051561 TaxID=3365658 RepID=UPI00378AED50